MHCKDVFRVRWLNLVEFSSWNSTRKAPPNLQHHLYFRMILELMKYSGIYILLALHCKHFTTISDHFIAIHINLFDKTKILAIILKFHQKLWHKKQIFSFFWIFYIFVKILFENLRLINGHFKIILDHFFGSKVMVHYWVNIFLKCIICHLRKKSALIFSK